MNPRPSGCKPLVYTSICLLTASAYVSLDVNHQLTGAWAGGVNTITFLWGFVSICYMDIMMYFDFVENMIPVVFDVLVTHYYTTCSSQSLRKCY